MTNINNYNRQIKAVSRYVRMSPIKVRRVINLIRNCSYQEASLILNFLPYKARIPIWYVLNSAVTNGIQITNKQKSEFKIKEAFVDKGPILKRARPRAKGRSYPIQKPTCHITIILE